jgi:hypothetical protein
MIKYKYFNTFLFRTPFFSFEELGNFETQQNSQVFKEMLQLASPDLYEEINEEDKTDRAIYSSYRYFQRACTRSTPFGLFAGCSMGTIGEKTEIILSDIDEYRRKTRPDMNYICALIQGIEKNKNIRTQLKYFPNTSIYKVGDDFRYVEYGYVGTRRFNRISSAESTDYLEQTLTLAKNGAEFSLLASSLVNEDEEISEDDAVEYIHELIDSQLLISELEPSVTNPDPLTALIVKLKNMDFDKKYLSLLESINEKLSEIDNNPVGSTNKIYPEIIKEIEETKIAAEIKYLFQADLYKPVHQASVSRKMMSEIWKTLEFLNRINRYYGNSSLSKFKENFVKRYEEREMSLLFVLDTEIGISYGNVSGDVSPLVDDLFVMQGNEQGNNISFDAFQGMMMQKYQTAFLENRHEIILTDEDIKGIASNPHWDDMPPTTSVICQILEDSGEKILFRLKSVGGSSAANLSGRFCHLDDSVLQHVLNITAKETEMNSEVIYAEIVHLPESRIGNVLLRPILRSYEIPYLAKSELGSEFEIKLSDLFVSVKNNRIVLRSKRLDKEIVPRLSSAHNYGLRSMPVYHFLCDLQHQYGRSGLGFFQGSHTQHFGFMPRVSYRSCILSPAQWTVQKKEIDMFVKIKNNDELVSEINCWKEKRGIPDEILLADGDNALYVNLRDALSIRSWLSVIKKRASFQLEEWLFNPETAVVKGSGGTFNNEFVFAFHKTQ